MVIIFYIIVAIAAYNLSKELERDIFNG